MLLYLAFPDGAISYDCASCTALCCRGFGFGGDLTREMGALFTRYPALAALPGERVGRVVTLMTLPGGCFFLDGDNRCRIEEEHGRELKPAVCRLFPFNVFSRIGDAVVISPHFLCPLRLRAGSGERHADIAAQALSSGFLEGLFLATRVPRLTLHKAAGPAEVLAREARFRDACGAALGSARFSAVLGGGPALSDFLARAAPLLGLEAPREGSRDELDDLMLALAPTKRLSALHLTAEGITRALALYELVLRRVAALAGRPLGLKEAHAALLAAGPAVRLVARGEEPLPPPKRGEKVPPFGEPALVFAVYTALKAARGPGGVLCALERAGERLAPAERSALTHALGARFEGAPGGRSP